MKKIITTFCLVLAGVFSFAQGSLRVLDDLGANVSNTIYDVNIMANSSVTTEFLVYNSDTIAHTYKCRRTIFTKDITDSTQFCFGGLCYNWNSNLSSASLTVAPGDTVDFAGFGFHAIFNSKLATITRAVHYRFYDTLTYPTSLFYDSTGVTIRYNFSTGIEDKVKTGGSISNAYPNPTSSVVSMKYDISDYSQNGQIIFYDMLGKSVKTIALSDKKGIAKINVDDLNSGIYFYSFLVDGKAISTRKLVVSSK
ncbi:MAG: T9SS type A sorting domain-containing protein [Bacteroidetes bacterium]|nr:T9SS type A sorting domain-containing protein [Bacteroidota bacterium]